MNYIKIIEFKYDLMFIKNNTGRVPANTMLMNARFRITSWMYSTSTIGFTPLVGYTMASGLGGTCNYVVIIFFYILP